MRKTNKTHCAILGMLSISPMSGYEIRQTIQESTANFWSESDGQLYPALAALMKLGLIAYQATKSNPTNARNKKVYRITPQGKKALQQWLQQEAETHITRNEFMLKLFFGANISPEINLAHIQNYHYQTKSRLSKLTETQQQLTKEHKDSPHLPYWMMSLDYGIQLTKTQLTWCENAMRALSKMDTGS